MSATSCWSAGMGVLLTALGCNTQGGADSYGEDALLYESPPTETNTNWRDHQREREQQAKWERDRTNYDHDYRRHYRDGW